MQTSSSYSKPFPYSQLVLTLAIIFNIRVRPMLSRES